MTRRELPARITRAIHTGRGLQSSVYEVDWDGTRGAVKDFSKLPPLFRFFIAPILVKREVKALKHLDGTPGIPRFLGQIDRLAFATQFIEGRPVSGIHKDELAPETFAQLFDSMAVVVTAMHARGVAHGDLKRRSNLIWTAQNEVFIIDFAASVVARGRVSRTIMRAVALVDEKSLPRLKRFVAPQMMTPDDLWKLENPTPLERWVKRLLGR